MGDMVNAFWDDILNLLITLAVLAIGTPLLLVNACFWFVIASIFGCELGVNLYFTAGLALTSIPIFKLMNKMLPGNNTVF